MILILLVKPFEFFPECIVQAFDESEDICPQPFQLILLKESMIEICVQFLRLLVDFEKFFPVFKFSLKCNSLSELIHTLLALPSPFLR